MTKLRAGPTGSVLCIGGLDPSGCAGLLADARMVTYRGRRPLLLPTQDTVQSRSRYFGSRQRAPAECQQDWDALWSEGPPAAIKVGAVASLEQARWLHTALSHWQGPLVLDPVLVSSSGGQLGLIEAVLELLPLATLITPNRAEAGAMLGWDANSLQPPPGVGSAVLVTGTDHAQTAGSTLVQHTLWQHGERTDFTQPLLPGRYRGTGCLLATSIACGLADGQTLAEACATSLAEVYQWIINAMMFDDGIHLPRPPCT